MKTLLSLEESGTLLDKVSKTLYNLNSEHPCELQKIAQEVFLSLTSFNNEIKHDEKLYERVKFVYNSNNSLSGEEKMLWKKHINPLFEMGWT